MISSDNGESENNHVIDLIFQSVQTTQMLPNSEGKVVPTLVLDELSLWCKTLTISSFKFGQLVFETMEFLRAGLNATHNMSEERAQIWIKEVIEIVNSVKKACDAKSSESMRNKDNSQSTLIDKTGRSSVEKIFTMKENAKSSLWSSIMGKEKDKMSDPE